MIKVPESHCPQCAKVLDAATDTQGDDAPKPGDLSVCVGCGLFLQFAPDLTVMVLAPEVLRQLSVQERVQLEKTRRAVLAMKESRKSC